MPTKKSKKKTSVKVRDLKPTKDAKGGYEKLAPPGVGSGPIFSKIHFGG